MSTTTLIEELELAAEDSECLSRGCVEKPCMYCQRAARLRARAAHVRRMMMRHEGTFVGREMRRLTGPDIGQLQEGEETPSRPTPTKEPTR